MKHILLTKFAVPFEPHNPRTRYVKDPHLYWSKRLYLFKKYTVPSVRAQRFKDFEWYIIVSHKFPKMSKYWKILESASEFGKLLPIEGWWNEKQPEIGEALRAYHYKEDWITTTRLDSDDIIANDFMERVHIGATHNEEWLTFPYGFMLRGNDLYSRKYYTNPFLTYVEEVDTEIKSAFHVSHIRARNLIDISGKYPAWIQVDHGDNIKNLVNIKNPKHCGEADQIRGLFTWE